MCDFTDNWKGGNKHITFLKDFFHVGHFFKSKCVRLVFRILCFGFVHEECGVLALWPGIKPITCSGRGSLNPSWTTRGSPHITYYIALFSGPQDQGFSLWLFFL